MYKGPKHYAGFSEKHRKYAVYERVSIMRSLFLFTCSSKEEAIEQAEKLNQLDREGNQNG